MKNKRTCVSSLLSAAALLGLTPVAWAANRSAKDEKELKAELAELRLAAAAVERGDCRTAAKLAAPVADNDGSLLPPEVKAAVFQLTASCEAAIGDHTAAYRHALAGTAFDDSPDELWRLRLGIEANEQRYAAAVTTVEAMTQGRGAALNGVLITWFYQFDNDLRRKGEVALRRRLLAVLGNGGYIPNEPVANVDGFRRRYAELLGEADKTTIANVIAQIEDASTLMDLSLNPRLRGFVPANFDVRQRVEANLAAIRTVAPFHPDLIAPVIRTATYLRVLGRPAEALAALNTIKDKVVDPAAFKDADEQLIWWWDERARTFGMLGRHDDEIAALRAGATNKESGGLNVSQVINLSQTQVDIGRPADALETLAVFDGSERNTSAYGAMQVRYTKACALNLLGRLADARADVQFVLDHQKDAPRTFTELMLCLGDLDGAAASFVDRLGNPETRVDALQQLSEYDAPPVAEPPGPLLKYLPALKSRADVGAAIVRAGGVRRFNIQRVTF